MSLSMNTNKIIQYLKENNNVFEILFFGIKNENFIVEPKLYFQNYHELIYSTHWLFENWCDNTKPTGIFKNDSIVFLEEDGVMVEYCKGLQNLPYVFLKFRGENFKNITQEYFDFIQNTYGENFENVLAEYEQWCFLNHIPLDKNSGDSNFCPGLGQKWVENPYYVNPHNLCFDKLESAISLTIKTLTTL